MRRSLAPPTVLTIALALVLTTSCATTGASKVDDPPIAEREDLDATPPPEAELSPIPAERAPAEALQPPSAEAEEEKSTAELLDEVVQEAEEDAAAPPPPAPISADSQARGYFEDAVAAAPGSPQRAMSLFERAGRRDPAFVLAWYNAGVAAERQGKLNAAVRYYHKALEAEPNHQLSLLNLVQIYRRLGRPQDAEAVARRALAGGRNAATLAVAGVAALINGKQSDAELFAKQALKVDELNIGAMLLLAEIYQRQRKYELARFVLNNASAIEPENALVLEGLGRALLKLDQKPAAKKKFEEAVALRQDLVESYVNLAALYYEVGDYGGAASASRQAVLLAPKLGAAWLNRGNALRAQRRYQEAIAAYRKAAELRGPSQALAHFNLGILYLDNEVPELDYLARIKLAVEHLESYRGRAQMSERDAERVDNYLTEARRLQGREEKKRERAAKRKADEEAKARAEAEAKRRAEEEARRKLEEEARLKAEEAARKKAAEDALKRKIGGSAK